MFVALLLWGCGDGGGTSTALTSSSVEDAGSAGADAAPLPTHTPAPPLDQIRLEVLHAPAGVPPRIQASLHLEDERAEIAGVQNDIEFDPRLPIAARANGRPDCSYDPVTGKNGSAFGFQPAGCIPGEDCIGVRAVVLSFGDTDPIPDGSILYSCNLAVTASTRSGLPYSFVCSQPYGGTPEGEPVALSCSGTEIEFAAQD